MAAGAAQLHNDTIDEVILGDEESEIEMMMRIEAEERAKLDAEDDEVQALQAPAGHGPSSAGMAERLGDIFSQCRGSSGGASSNGKVDLSSVAYRFGMIGCMSFGGSPAQVSLMRSQPWRSELADDAAFSSLVALCECLPGFSAAQVATALGVLQAGPYGGLVAVGAYAACGTLAMALLGVVEFAPPPLGARLSGGAALVGAMQMGIAASGVALVSKSALQLTSVHAKEPLTRSVCLAAAALAACLPEARWLPPVVLVSAGLASCIDKWWRARAARLVGADGEEAGSLQEDDRANDEGAEGVHAGGDASEIATTFVPLSARVGIATGVLWLVIWLLLAGLYAAHSDSWWLSILEGHYRCGSLVWGGGTAALPLVLREETPSLVRPRAFLGGTAYSLALPGPSTFNLAAYAGGSSGGTLAALIAAAAIHLPGVLLLYTALPFWRRVRASAWAQTALRGVNAASSGLVVACALVLLQSASTPPQHAVSLVTFASVHLGWPASAIRCAPRYQPAMTVALGAALGVPICLPWLLTSHPLSGGAPSAALTATPAGAYASSHRADEHADGLPPPPPFPAPPDPSPPPPPRPRPPEGAEDD